MGWQDRVKSPTYTLVEEYQVAQATVYHFDLYRLADPEELEYMGIRDYFDNDSICLVEWPERGAGVLPLADIMVSIEAQGAGRLLAARSETPRGQQILAQLSKYETD
jgi:tRNA threonylcarbamoyladenosine biosynthesis protein TsaE